MSGELLELPMVAQSREETWVNFKLFGMMESTLVFVVAQAFHLARHVSDSTDPEEMINMYYAIIAEDKAGSLNDRLKARPAHLDRVRQLQDAGRLLLAGPHPAIDSQDPGDAGFTGSLIVAEFSDLEAARAWAAADPYVTAGVFAKVTVKPFRKVFPE